MISLQWSEECLICVGGNLILEHNTNKKALGLKFGRTTPLEHLKECDKEVGSIEFSLFRNKHQVVKIDGSTKLTAVQVGNRIMSALKKMDSGLPPGHNACNPIDKQSQQMISLQWSEKCLICVGGNLISEHNTNKNARGLEFRRTTPLEHLKECDKAVGSTEFSLFRISTRLPPGHNACNPIDKQSQQMISLQWSEKCLICVGGNLISEHNTNKNAQGLEFRRATPLEHLKECDKEVGTASSRLPLGHNACNRIDKQSPQMISLQWSEKCLICVGGNLILEHNTNKNARGLEFRRTTPSEPLKECDKELGSIEFSLFRNKHQIVKIDGSTMLTAIQVGNRIMSALKKMDSG
ncbi:hypothetical protein CDAR_498931 [Caerostris darwini]|uniref:Uncharacterized protein n=1 Tax=Caerostris darwini TaxID=1538125 RepID=A0AAV4Q2I3_9ARAC|nr:hypothetical protein CDAR_498931 [Caerostris darwini]